MTSVQRFLSGHDNLVRTAVLSASSVRPASAIERVAASRAGGGRVRLVGEYSGHEATDIEVEIVAAGGVPRASVPTFSGVGNGKLAVLDVDGAAPLQALTFTLRDLGVQTEHAKLDVREVVIRARSPGALGNSIRLTVTPALTRTATDYALLAAWTAGTRAQVGEQWDFGGLPVSASGELDTASPRVQFGFDPTVYRCFREYKDGAWQHGLSPALERDLAAGTRVWAVTGGYTVTVTDGTDTETYEDLVTFYDLLSALAASALVEVAGVVAADRRIGGQAAIDVPLRTSAWLFAMSGKVRLEQVAVPAAAPTQSVTIRCINADTVGRERWSVAGTVTGVMPAAVTGDLYTHAAVGFLVPTISPATADGGEWSFKYQPTQRADGEGEPSVCIRPFRFGRNAKGRTVTFQYKLRPPADCKCSTMPTPKLSMACLGLSGEEEMALDAEYQTRLEALYEWRSGFFAENTAPESARAFSAVLDMDFSDLVTSTLAAALAEVYSVAPAAAEWDAAFTEMQVELEWLLGLSPGGSSGFVQTSPQFGNVGNYYHNQHNDHYYELTGVTKDGVPQDGGDGSPVHYDEGEEPQVSSVWATDGSSFTITRTRTYDGTVWVFTYRDDGTDHPNPGVPIDNENFDAGSVAGIPLVSRTDLENLARRYSARMDYVRTLAGIVPKSDASSDAGACWRDYPDETHWWVDVDGYYLPAFTNKPYISARRNTETGEPYSTFEFGFGLVVACPERLKVDDTLTIKILVIDGERPYQVGDEAIIETVAAGPAWLGGGVDGTDELTWSVYGSDSGVLADYVVPLSGVAPVYSAAGIEARISLGGIPFALGDAFALAVEAGQFRWRRDEGAWSAAADIPASGPVALADGVSALFDAGAAPSFVPDDAFGFRVHQPHAVSNVRTGHVPAWRWAGDEAEITIDFGDLYDVSSIAVARFELPPGGAMFAQLSADGLAWSSAIVLDTNRPVAVAMIPTPAEARYLRVSVYGATGGSIGWIWAGVPVTTRYHATTCEPSRRYAVGRGNGLNPSSLYAGRGVGWSVAWDAQLFDADVQKLVDIVDWMHANDEPMVFVPHHLNWRDAALVSVGSDALELPDYHHYQPNNADHRLLSAALTLEAVIA